MPVFRRPRVVRRRRDGQFDLVLDAPYRAALADLLGQLDALLEHQPDDPALLRLRPPAYPDEPERDAEYQLLAGEELRAARRQAIEEVVASLQRDRLGEDELWQWLRSLNALRLVLATRLDITDEDENEGPADLDGEDAPVWAAYGFLGLVQQDVVEALGG